MDCYSPTMRTLTLSSAGQQVLFRSGCTSAVSDVTPKPSILILFEPIGSKGYQATRSSWKESGVFRSRIVTSSPRDSLDGICFTLAMKLYTTRTMCFNGGDDDVAQSSVAINRHVSKVRLHVLCQ